MTRRATFRPRPYPNDFSPVSIAARRALFAAPAPASAPPRGGGGGEPASEDMRSGCRAAASGGVYVSNLPRLCPCRESDP
jgi:hypothetical protein